MSERGARMFETGRPRAPKSRHGRQHQHAIYANCTTAERLVVGQTAAREGLSISDFVRRCINAYLLEEPDDVCLLEEQRTKDRVAR